MTIEVTNEDREIIAAWFGTDGKAKRADVQAWVQHVLDAELESMSTE